MRLTAAILIIAGSSLASAATHKTRKPAPEKKTEAITIPKGAVQTDDGYRFTDAAGKVWVYRVTPFGTTKSPYKAPAPPPPPTNAADEKVTAKEIGDSIRFERTGPFGVTNWQKKKAELTPEEQAIWARQQK